MVCIFDPNIWLHNQYIEVSVNRKIDKNIFIWIKTQFLDIYITSDSIQLSENSNKKRLIKKENKIPIKCSFNLMTLVTMIMKNSNSNQK